MKMKKQEQTRDSFKDKWSNHPDLIIRQTLDPSSEIHKWLMTRNGFLDSNAFAKHLATKRRILDAGCGNGRILMLLAHLAPHAEIVGIDFASADIARENAHELPNVTVQTQDLLGPLEHLGRFDLVWCQEVLHHTADPRLGFLNLAGLLAPGGEIAIYVYKQKAPIREFTDNYLRQQVAALSYSEAMRVCRSIAELGRQLSSISEQVTVPEIRELGIEAGTYSVQRFIYHFMMKCFWNDDMPAEANSAVNFDWYHPQIASRHTPEEVRDWVQTAGLSIAHEHVDHYGITIRCLKRT